MNWRLFLLPFSFIYDIITRLRNVLFNHSIISSQNHALKTIVVGNLSVGGTGKSPFILYLMSLLGQDREIAVISRGYGRKTTGYRLLDEFTNVEESGDEPMMFSQFAKENTHVAVCEDRNEGVYQILKQYPHTQCILLDDAYQHRRLKSGFNILLTTFNQPFFEDFILPAGNLREGRYAAKRADLIVVTKCPKKITENQKNRCFNALKKYNKPVFFSEIIYDEIKPVSASIHAIKSVLVVAGIANPSSMLEYLKSNFQVESILFPDHHAYTEHDIQKIHRKFDNFASDKIAIVTTFKDFMRLKDKYTQWGMNKYPWYILPITIQIDREQEFNKLINNYVGKI